MVNMKQVFFALVLFAPLFATAGQLRFSCIGPNTPDCPLAIEATLNNERLTVQFITGPAVGGFYPNATLGYCAKSPWRSEAGWTERGCVETGTFRVLNGELTKLQLSKVQPKFEFHSPAAFCMEYFTTEWTTRCFNQNINDPSWGIF